MYDYLRITDGTHTIKNCGKETVVIKNKFCSNMVEVSYIVKTTYSASNFRGFKLYYEGIS